MTPERSPAMTLPTRLLALLLGLAIGVLWAAQAAGAPALPDLVIGEAATVADAAGRSADRPGTATAGPAGETDVSPPGGLPSVAAAAAAPGTRPQRVALPHAPWIEGLLRPPRAC